MNDKKVKRIRKELFEQGVNIIAEPYNRVGNQVVASKGRRIYQARKKR